VDDAHSTRFGKGELAAQDSSVEDTESPAKWPSEPKDSTQVGQQMARSELLRSKSILHPTDKYQNIFSNETPI
jgi:hypothetical protein